MWTTVGLYQAEGYRVPQFHGKVCASEGGQEMPQDWISLYSVDSKCIHCVYLSGHLRASCVSRSRHLPWPLCLMALLAFSCCCAIGAQCHARAPCTTPSTPFLWWVECFSVWVRWRGKKASVWDCSSPAAVIPCAFNKTLCVYFFRYLSMPGSGPQSFTPEIPISLRYRCLPG